MCINTEACLYWSRQASCFVPLVEKTCFLCAEKGIWGGKGEGEQRDGGGTDWCQEISPKEIIRRLDKALQVQLGKECVHWLSELVLEGRQILFLRRLTSVLMLLNLKEVVNWCFEPSQPLRVTSGLSKEVAFSKHVLFKKAIVPSAGESERERGVHHSGLTWKIWVCVMTSVELVSWSNGWQSKWLSGVA